MIFTTKHAVICDSCVKFFLILLIYSLKGVKISGFLV